ncbi:MAG: OadG family protein [Bacteroidales bacterium]|nr:OadG family protein [Bacteroidales bacterium]
MEYIGTGLMLMGVGMLTVFCILLIVIYGSRLLIVLVNKIAPEAAAVEAAPAFNPAPVLEEAVKQLTGGKGRIVKISEL